MSKAILCNKNHQLAWIEIENDKIINIIKLEADARCFLPPSLADNPTPQTLTKWLASRFMPKTRDGLNIVEKSFKWKRPYYHMASLIDHYWFQRDPNEDYEKINYFTNRYKASFGNLFFAPWLVGDPSYFEESPDLTCGGRVKKRWVQEKEKNEDGIYMSHLRKTGNRSLHQFPVIEVIVSDILDHLNIIDHVVYHLIPDGLEICSDCENFVNYDTEFIPASQLLAKARKKNNENKTAFDLIREVCEIYDIPNAETFIRNMIFIDKLIYNTDRNFSNFGFLRDVETGKYVGPAPLYDHGSCLFNWTPKNGEVQPYLFSNVQEKIYVELIKDHEEVVHSLPLDSYYTLLDRSPGITEDIKIDIKEHLEKLIF